MGRGLRVMWSRAVMGLHGKEGWDQYICKSHLFKFPTVEAILHHSSKHIFRFNSIIN